MFLHVNHTSNMPLKLCIYIYRSHVAMCFKVYICEKLPCFLIFIYVVRFLLFTCSECPTVYIHYILRFFFGMLSYDLRIVSFTCYYMCSWFLHFTCCHMSHATYLSHVAPQVYRGTQSFLAE